MYPICSDGSFSKNIPLVPNLLGVNNGHDKEPFKPEAETSHQISTDESPYAVCDIGNSGGFKFQASHEVMAYDRLESLQTSKWDSFAIHASKPSFTCTYVFEMCTKHIVCTLIYISIHINL